MEDHEDTGPNPIVARADALMQRQRARGPQPEDVPLLTEVVDPNADLPVLVAEDSPVMAIQEIESFSQAAMEIMAKELAQRLSTRLAEDIPGMIETALQATLPELTRNLQAELTKGTDAAIQEFLAERAKLAKLQQS